MAEVEYDPLRELLVTVLIMKVILIMIMMMMMMMMFSSIKRFDYIQTFASFQAV